jgi:hypothetical protein
MNLHSITFWEKSPLLLRQKEPVLESISKEMSDILYKQFGSPFFHFFILNKLIAECKKRLHNNRSPIAMVDIYIPNSILQQLMSMFKNKWMNSDVFLIDMGIWLTEQLAANSVFKKDTSIPTIYTRCFNMMNMDTKVEAFIKKSGVPGSNQFLTNMFSILGIELLHPIFYLLFPPINSFTKISISSKAPSISIPLNKLDFESDTIIFGTKNFENIGIDKIRTICPLVSNKHIEIALSVGPSDSQTYGWIKHLGENETWILQNDQNYLKWELVPEDAWTLIRPENRIVLGRAAEIQTATSNEMTFISGSMVLTVEY